MADLFRIKAYYGAREDKYDEADWKLVFDVFLDENGTPGGAVDTFGFEEDITNDYISKQLIIIHPDMTVTWQKKMKGKDGPVIVNRKHRLKFYSGLNRSAEFEYHTDDIYVFTVREMHRLTGRE